MYRTRKLAYEDIPTACSNWMLCMTEGKNGPDFWPAWIPTADANDYAHRLEWEEGIEYLREAGLTIGIDKNGYAHIRYVDGDAKRAAQSGRRAVRREGFRYLRDYQVAHGIARGSVTRDLRKLRRGRGG